MRDFGSQKTTHATLFLGQQGRNAVNSLIRSEPPHLPPTHRLRGFAMPMPAKKRLREQIYWRNFQVTWASEDYIEWVGGAPSFKMTLFWLPEAHTWYFRAILFARSLPHFDKKLLIFAPITRRPLCCYRGVRAGRDGNCFAGLLLSTWSVSWETVQQQPILEGANKKVRTL